MHGISLDGKVTSRNYNSGSIKCSVLWLFLASSTKYMYNVLYIIQSILKKWILSKMEWAAKKTAWLQYISLKKRFFTWWPWHLNLTSISFHLTFMPKFSSVCLSVTRESKTHTDRSCENYYTQCVVDAGCKNARGRIWSDVKTYFNF